MKKLVEFVPVGLINIDDQTISKNQYLSVEKLAGVARCLKGKMASFLQFSGKRDRVGGRVPELP